MNVSITNVPPPGEVLRRLRWFLDTGGDTESWPAAAQRLLPFAAAYTLLHGVLVAAGFFLSTVPEEAVALWPAVGLLCAMLAATRRTTWPLWILCSIIGRIIFETLIIDNRSLIEPIIFSCVNAVEALIFAVFMQRPLIEVYRYGRPLYLVVALTAFAFIAAVIGGLTGAAILQRMQVDAADLLQMWRVWLTGDFVGIILITPLALWQLLPQIRIQYGRASWPEIVAMPVVLLLLVPLAILLTPDPGDRFASAIGFVLVFFLAVPVFWAALRAEFRIAAAMQLLLAVAVILPSSYGLGPLGHSADNYLPALIQIQLFMLVTVLVATLISSTVLEQERTERESILHQQFSDLLVQLTTRLVAAKTEVLDDVIEQSLELLGKFAKADRCVLLQMDERGQRVVATHAWKSGELTELPLEVTRADLARYPWAVEQIMKHGYLLLRDFDKGLPEGAQELENIRQSAAGTVDTLYVGLFADERIIGFIGYSYARRGVRWSNESISLMYLVGQMFANILQRKKAERDLLTYRDRLRSLAAEMSIAEERTRRRTATDLHDGIGQNLAVARMKIGQAMASGLSSGDLVQARNLIDDALRGTRYIIADLSPSILYELGLMPALESLAERFEPANNITCAVEVRGEPWSPDNDLRITLYRAVQECLNNIARHAQAQTVTIKVMWFPDKIDIEVSDDGVGFEMNADDESLLTSSGFGLFSIRENLALVDGTLTIRSARGIGTTVLLCAPRKASGEES